MTPEATVDAAVSAGLSILAITDHNTILGVRPAISRSRLYAANLLVIPGIELSTPQGHVLVYFDPDRVEQLEKFFHHLTINNDEQDSRTTSSLVETIDRAALLGGISIAAHIDVNKGFESGQPGYPGWKRDVLCNPGLYGLEFRKSEHRAWYSFEEPPGTPEADNRRKIYGARVATDGIRAAGALARFTNSDAHSLVRLAASKSVTRIKLTDLTYTSFLSALADPDARIKIDEPLPRATSRIVGLEIAGGFLANEAVHFSPNLNVFFGGRGTGKTTAIRALAFALGYHNEEDLPFDASRVYCEDLGGARYRFDRAAGGTPAGLLLVQGDAPPSDISPDAFPVEYFGQGELESVAREALSNPATLQDFLDKHIRFDGLFERERALAKEAIDLGAQLAPLVLAEQTRAALEKQLTETDARLKASEGGKLDQVAIYQNRLNAERSLKLTLAEAAAQYRRGLYARSLIQIPGEMRKNAGVDTFSTSAAETIFKEADQVVEGTNDYVTAIIRDANRNLLERSKKLDAILDRLSAAHATLSERIQNHIDKLRDEGLASSLKEFEQISKRKAEIVASLSRLNSQKPQLDELRERYDEALQHLQDLRSRIIARRKEQLTAINRAFKETFPQYRVVIVPEISGMTSAFELFVDAGMHGSRFPRELTSRLCRIIDPTALAESLESADTKALYDLVGDWATDVMALLGVPEKYLLLKTIWKPYVPIIKIWESGENPRELKFAMLSDGQKHTILLTVALLSDARYPLIIDQPEDDLDNIFISRTVVETLRRVKETRQVILVTHNANIAVLGDSEQLLGMEQVGSTGRVATRGSIDEAETKMAVQDCLEGGEEALRRRAEVYGWNTSRIMT